MNITLSAKTQQLLEARMEGGGYSSPDEAIRVALETLEGEAIEDLDPTIQEASARADAQAERGEGTPIDVGFERLRRKHFGA